MQPNQNRDENITKQRKEFKRRPCPHQNHLHYEEDLQYLEKISPTRYRVNNVSWNNFTSPGRAQGSQWPMIPN